MASTTFTDFVTPVPAAWLNDVNAATYTQTPANTTAIATETTRALAAEALLAPKASPTFTGVPAAPTAVAGTNTTQLATTAYVVGQAATTTPVMDGIAAVGVSTTFARADHVHASDTTKAPIASPTFTGVPVAPTAASGTNTTQVATTAFVTGGIATAVAPLATTAFVQAKFGQVIYVANSAAASGTTLMPSDNTIPQITEGTQFLSASITPTNAASILEIEVYAQLTHTVAAWITGALFQNATANALTASTMNSAIANSGGGLLLKYRMTAGTTASTTFSFRAGGSPAGTTKFNSFSTINMFGGVANSYMKITEYTP